MCGITKPSVAVLINECISHKLRILNKRAASLICVLYVRHFLLLYALMTIECNNFQLHIALIVFSSIRLRGRHVQFVDDVFNIIPISS